MGLKTYIKRYLSDNPRESRYRGEDQEKAFNPYSSKKAAASSINLKIVEDPSKGVLVQNLQEIPVSEASELMDLIQLGNQKRFVANTGANKFSSRSHAILIFNIEGQDSGGKFTRSKL
jgi:hypothetical protein